MNTIDLNRSSLLAVITSLLAHELKALRHQSSHHLGSEKWSASTLIGEVEDTSLLADDQVVIGADSLELVSLATCVATFFNIYESGLEDYLLRFKTLGEWAELVETARKRGSRNITFATSGSTGTPKQCLQRWDDLVAESLYFAELLGPLSNQPAQRVIALSPCHHIYGFIFSVLLPAQMGISVLHNPNALAAIQQRDLRAGDLIIGFPFIWRQLTRQGTDFPEGITGITSTGPCDAIVIRQLQEQGLERMFEIYGSSETSGIGFRESPEAAYRLLPRWQRSSQTNALCELETGDIHLLSDYLDWQDETRFHPAGRRDNAVQVGGINVFPNAIAERLQRLPEVSAAAVRLMSPDEGERLKAFIVPAKGFDQIDALQSTLQNWCSRNLDAAERPRAFTFGAAVPCNVMGKSSDWSIHSEGSSLK